MDPKDRPDLDGNDETGAGAAAATAVVAGGQEEGFVRYAAAGREFTNWFNSMLTRTPNPALKLGTKTARVETLHDDGRLEVYVGDGEGEQQFVAFNEQHLDALLLKFASASR